MIAKERTKGIPEKKIQLVNQLTDLSKKKQTIMICSIKNIPTSKFQEIVKKLRGKAIIKVPKKNLIFRALNSADEKIAESLKEKIGDSTAFLFSDLDCFELAMELAQNKTPAKAKAGQEAPEDISVQKGPTDLPPGPAISELGDLGLKVQIEKGKISIKEEKIIVKKGEKISSEAASIMGKLEMKPFTVQFKPIVAFDNKNKKLYSNININQEEALENLKYAFGRAIPFSVEIGYVNEDTIGFLISKAGAHEKILENLLESKNTKEDSEEKKSEEKNKESEEDEKKEENKEQESEKGENKKEDEEEKSKNTQKDQETKSEETK